MKWAVIPSEYPGSCQIPYACDVYDGTGMMIDLPIRYFDSVTGEVEFFVEKDNDGTILRLGKNERPARTRAKFTPPLTFVPYTKGPELRKVLTE